MVNDWINLYLIVTMVQVGLVVLGAFALGYNRFDRKSTATLNVALPADGASGSPDDAQHAQDSHAAHASGH